MDGDESHIENTVIDGIFLPKRDSSSLVYFISGEDSNSVLKGFTLQNGKGTQKITGNSASSFNAGGGIFLDSSGAKIENNIFKNNSLESYFCTAGAGIECIELPADKSVIINNNTFYDNQLDGKVSTGGAIDLFIIEGEALISKNKIYRNKIKAKDSGYGGGICIYGSSSKKIVIENNYISNNETASGYPRGGGIAIQEAHATIRNNILLYNISQRKGSYAARGGGISVRFDNSVNSYHKVNLLPYAMNVIIENNTILFNKSSDAGSGISSTDASAKIVNNIVRGNKTITGTQIFKEQAKLDYRKINLIVKYSNIEGGFNGEENVDKDPNFEDSTYFCLTKNNSECIDAGDPSDKYFDVPNPDIIGRPKAPAYGSRRNDMGAFGGPNSKWADMGIITDVENELISEIPNTPYLSQNYPNPFNPRTTIKYSIPSESVMS